MASPCSTREQWHTSRNFILSGGVAERLNAPVLKFEIKILDRIGQFWTGLFWRSDSRLANVFKWGQQWTAVPSNIFYGLLLRVTRLIIPAYLRARFVSIGFKPSVSLELCLRKKRAQR